jgi:hypothetical protein
MLKPEQYLALLAAIIKAKRDGNEQLFHALTQFTEEVLRNDKKEIE